MKIVETTCSKKKIGSNILIVDKFYNKRTYNIGGYKHNEICLHVKYHHI